MSQEFRNLTPHAVRVIDPCCCEYDPRTRSYRLVRKLEVIEEIAPENGDIPRVATVERHLYDLHGVPIISIGFGELENLPDANDNDLLITSAIVANAGRKLDRKDLLVPSRMVRDNDGNIVGCSALAIE